MDLSISIVSHNTVERLRQCLDHIYKNTRDISFEILISDNCSKDNTDMVVYKEFPEARLIINDRNIGFARANNAAINMSRGKYVFVTNPDVIVLPDSLKKMIEFMESRKDAGITGCKLIYPDGRLQHSCRNFPTFMTFLLRGTPIGALWQRNGILDRYMLADWDHSTTREVDWCLGSCLLARREMINEVGLMDGRFFLYYEDIDWCYRAKKKGWKIYYYPDSVMVHFYKRESATLVPNRLTFHHMKSALYFFFKYLPERGLRTFY